MAEITNMEAAETTWKQRKGTEMPETIAEAIGMVEKIAQEHPEYLFGRTSPQTRTVQTPRMCRYTGFSSQSYGKNLPNPWLRRIKTLLYASVAQYTSLPN
ncbi:MAG: hypothetical protein Q8Q15_01730 [bacterium]|nr:hypothetical protein [bacterium]